MNNIVGPFNLALPLGPGYLISLVCEYVIITNSIIYNINIGSSDFPCHGNFRTL